MKRDGACRRETMDKPLYPAREENTAQDRSG
mgnify:CR=1 FL=1